MARSTKDYNNLLNRYIEVLSRMEANELEAGAPGLAGAATVDCAVRLKKASQAIKTIQFHCHNLVARDVDRIVDIKTSTRGDGGRGPENVIDLVQGCQLFCRVGLKGRKQPIRLFIR